MERVQGRGMTYCMLQGRNQGVNLPPPLLPLNLLQGPLACSHRKPWGKGAVCAFTSQPPETQSRLGRMWVSQEGAAAHLPGTSLLWSSDGISLLDTFPCHSLVCISTLALCQVLTFPASTATKLLRGLPPTAHCTEDVTTSWYDAVSCRTTCTAKPSLQKPDDNLQPPCTSSPALHCSGR